MGRVHDPNVARVAEQLTAHEQQIRALKNRKPGLAYSSIENGAIDEYDESGQLVSRTGRQHDGTHGHVVLAGPRPMVPSRPQANALAGLVEVRWNGKFEGDQPSPLDFKHVAGYVVPEGEALDLSHQSGVVTSELGDNFQVQVDPGTYWVYLVTWTLAGKFSEPSERAVVEVHLPADVAQIEAKLDELDEKYDGVITEAGRLGEVLEQAEQDLAAHEDRMNAADDVLAELQDETLPALRSSLDELENTTLPAMDQRLSQAQQELADAGAELSDRLDDAFIEIDTAAGVADEAKTAAQGAQSVADDAADAAAAAAGIAGAKADVLIQSTAPATAMRKATTLWIDTTGGANTPKRWSGSAWVAVTDKAATDAAAQAAAAQAAAAAAQSAAGSAQTTANSALTMAGTKNAVYYSTSVATGTGTRQGDLWRQIDSTGDVVGEWQWTGTSWAKRMISSSAISNLDVGKLTAGTSFISEAVINKLWAEVITARKILVENLAVGSFDNWFNTKPFETLNPADGWVLEGEPGVTLTSDLLTLTTAGTTVRLIHPKQAVEPGQKFKVTLNDWARVGSAGTIYIYGRWFNSAGTQTNVLVVSRTTLTGTWEGEFTVPDGAVALQFYLNCTATAEGFTVGKSTIRKMVDGNIIATGSITGDHVEGNSVAAKIGQFLELDVSQLRAAAGSVDSLVAAKFAAATASIQTCDIANLFVTTGTMSEAVINKLWADVVHSRLITAEMLAIGAFSNVFPDADLKDAQGWPSTAELLPGQGRDGRNAMRITSTSVATSWYYGLPSTGRVVPVQPGRSYRIKGWIKPSQTPSSTAIIRFFTRLYGEDGSYITPSPQTISPAVIPPAGQWTELSGVIKVPDGESAHLRLAFGPNIAASYPVGATVLFADPLITEMSSGELIVDGSVTAESVAANAIKAAHMDVGDIFADTGFVTALRSKGVQIFDDDGAEVINLTGEGDSLITIRDSATGNALASLGSDGTGAFSQLMSADTVRADGSVVFGGDPIAAGHGTGEYGVTMNGRDMLGVAYMSAVDLHPDMQDGNAWMTMAPHGMKINAWNDTTGNLGSDGRWGWASGEARMMLTATTEFLSGRQYFLQYRTPAVRETGTLGTGDVGAAHVRYATGSGVVNASKGTTVPGTRFYLARGGGYQTAALGTMLRCPEDIPAGKVMFGVELYTYTGRTAQSTDTADARRWELSVIDMGMRISSNSGSMVNLRTGGTEPDTPDPTPDPTPPKQYTQTFSPSWYQTYFDGGARQASSNWGGKVAQGYYNSTTGYMKGLVAFPSLVSTLSGATVKKIEVYVYAEHWWSSAGGTLVIGTHGSTAAAAPASYTGGSTDVMRQSLKKPEGRWVTLPSSVHAGFKAGTIRGIMAYIASTSKTYYGALTGSKTRLRVTYTK